jgi:threonine synthase
MVFYPQDGVSPAQKLQMITQEGENVSVCAIKGNFDDAQTAVKKIFTSPEVNKALLKNNMQFSSANSINWGRLAPQIVYYFSAYADLLKQHAIKCTDDKVNIVVPTGNFGNILAAYYAKYMGLPINKLICASNSNKILTDFINTGIYDKNREFHTTISPSMDILISSNLERLLYHLCNGESDRIKGWMSSLEQKGVYEVEDDVKALLSKLFYAGFCSEEETKGEIYRLFKDFGYLADTHTAVASYVCGEYRRKTGDKLPCIIASTASPFKFSSSVLEALGNENEGLTEFEKIDALAELTRIPAPEPLKGLENKAVRFEDVCTDETMIQTVFDMLGIKE